MGHTPALQRVERVCAQIAEDPCNSFVVVDRAGAEKAAKASDLRFAERSLLGPLDGETVAIKDNIDTAGLRTTLGSRAYSERVPIADARVVELIRDAGGVIIGKTHLTELCLGTTGRNAWLGDALHPMNPDRYPGGSSSGSAIAVASGFVRFALGTDTGGSIRHPSAACGIVGLKPTFGRVSTSGVPVTYASMDHVGPMAKTVHDAAVLLDVISDLDPAESTAAGLNDSVEGLRVGVLGGDFVDACDDDVRSAFDQAVDVLRGLGCHVGPVMLDVDLAGLDAASDAFGRDFAELHTDLLVGEPDSGGSRTRADQQADEVQMWLRVYSDITDADYEAAQNLQRSVTSLVNEVMAEWDVLVCPSIRVAAGSWDRADTEDRLDRVGNLVLWDITGQPSLTLPCGWSQDGMPLGLLINGRFGEDAVVLRLGAAVEQGLGDM